MVSRREVLKLGIVSAGFNLLNSQQSRAHPTSGLVFPDGFVPSVVSAPSPPVTPFAVPLNVPPIAQSISAGNLYPPPEPSAHHRYNEFPPAKFYTESLEEFRWVYHTDPPYNVGSWSWGFRGYGMDHAITPGPTYHAKYGEPVFVRRFNNLPAVGTAKATFALPSPTIHLHNAHTASESDGFPMDFFWPGQFYDHHYANFPAGFDNRELLSTLWYHDHRLDFTAPNVYAGLVGFYLLFDEFDSNNELDPNTEAFHLPSGEFDVPLVLHDVQFDASGQVVWDFFNPEPVPEDSEGPLGRFPSALSTVNGMLGDRFTVNRIIQPFFTVEGRKYRFRVLNGGPSRSYTLYLQSGSSQETATKIESFHVISTDGNLLPAPIQATSILLDVAQRHDIIVDFSSFQPGDHIFMVNRREMRSDGAGWTGREKDPGDFIMRFDVVASTGPDLSQIPARMFELPPIDLNEVRRERLFVFDYDNGMWTINGRIMDPNRVDAAVEEGSAEIWTIRNTGDQWMHPVHNHFEEFQIMEINGKPIPDGDVRKSRKDVLSLGPNEEAKIFLRNRDFQGKYVMHCHNVLHEDHSMMIRWDSVPPGTGD